MLVNTLNIKGLVIRAQDGELGTVDELYFDDKTWTIRYLTVETGGWLDGRHVLVSPLSILQIDLQAKRLDVALTKKQVEDSPGVETHLPVSRQHEAAYLAYYGYPYYWDGPNLWGPAYYPIGFMDPVFPSAAAVAEKIRKQPADSHLRSSAAVKGYHIDAVDGEIGHLDRLIVDDKTWSIRYLELATQNWWPGKKVLISPEWVERVSWADSKVYVALTREAIKACPQYLDGQPITREYENHIYFHYGRPPYWLADARDKPSLSLTNV